MTLSLQRKLQGLVVVAAAALALMAGVGVYSANKVAEELERIQVRLIPRLELRPRLEAELERTTRAFHDAVAARDLDLLDVAAARRKKIMEALEGARRALHREDVVELRRAIDAYYDSAEDVSRRLIADEEGEAVVRSVRRMQSLQERTRALALSASKLEENELETAFAKAVALQQRSLRLRLMTSVACVLAVAFLVVLLSRAILASIEKLSEGLERFGRGELGTPIAVDGHDELAHVARRANSMASRLDELRRAQDTTVWIGEGLNGLARELRGELSPSSVATRSVAFLARYLEVPAAALYVQEGEGGPLCIAGTYAMAVGGDAGDGPRLDARKFAEGEGFVGQAFMHPDPTRVTSLPASYFRIQSGLGDGSASELLLVPLVPSDRPTGVLELALLRPVRAGAMALLESAQRTVAIALEVARAREEREVLLRETQDQAARLQQQEEELRSANEELEFQQDELRQVNAELTTQTEALEENWKVLERRNLDLENARGSLEARADELAAMSSYKSQFLTNMSHELRTPLNSMLLLSNLLGDNQGGNLTEQQVGYCQTIHTAGQQLLKLINQILDLAKVEAGKIALNLGPVEPRRLADYVESSFAPVAHDKGLTLQVRVEPDVPPRITSDEQRLLQILNNLVGNAIKFTAEGSVALRFSRPAPAQDLGREGLSPEDAITIEIVDTGPGVSREDQERVFEAFEQADASIARRHGGTGLGLAISRELAGLLGGNLTLTSTVGEGTTFACHLPIGGPVLVEDEPVAAPAKAPGASRALPESASSGRGPSGILVIEDDEDFAGTIADKPTTRQEVVGVVESLAPRRRTDSKRILVVEDDAVLGESLLAQLAKEGLRARRVNTAELAMKALEEEHYDCMILDLALPGMSGLQLLEACKSSASIKLPPVVVHTARALTHAEARRLEAYAEAIVLKEGPSIDRLLNEIRMFASGSKAQAHRPPSEDAPPIPSSVRNKTILVVDDDMRTVYALSALLRSKGFQVMEADTGAMALSLLDGQPEVDLVLMDIMMPEMDGYTAMTKLRADDRFATLPVIALSAKAMKGDAERCLAAGATAYLPKPVDTQKLIGLIVQCLSSPSDAERE